LSANRQKLVQYGSKSEAHDPKIADARAVAVEAAVISASELDQGVMTPEEQPHRPRLVPGAGTL
jgi:hypothetical protein